MGNIKDKFWLWGHPAGSHNFIVKKFSRITPAEACYYMDIENLIFVRFYGDPPYFLYEKYAISFEPLKNVIWSIVGANGETSENDFEFFLKIAEKFKNIKGAITDDFFYNGPKGGRWAVYDLDYLKKVKNILKSRGLELWGVLYYHQIDLPLKDYIDFFDVMTLWIWEAKDILRIGDFFEKFKKLYPSVLATWTGLHFAKENKYSSFDFMGAGFPNIPYGVREFKSKFGGQLVNYGRFRKIHYKSIYYLAQLFLSFRKKK